ncbi:MAG TPA: competence protein [Legionellales bacterium]|nr:competence protein [Legionellales bacterium]
MSIAILATGNELISGDTLNTNAQYIALSLSRKNIRLGLQMTCSDDEQDIIAGLRFLTAKHEGVILIGGLGPTSDDRTRFALSQFLSSPLIEFSQAQTHIRQRLAHRQSNVLNQGFIQQTLFPKHAQLLPNPHGTAMGCYVAHHQRHFILLPGPPRECLPMFDDFALNFIAKLACYHDTTLLWWRVFGITESAIATLFETALEAFNCELSYRLETPYVQCKVRCKPELANDIKTIIEPKIRPYVLNHTNEKASVLLQQKLMHTNQTITIIDETTGGMLQTLLHTPTTYKKVFFQERFKTDIYLHVRGLEPFWQQNKTAANASVRLTVTKGNHQTQETHTFPLYGALVIHYVTEWLCFRLFHLID